MDFLSAIEYYNNIINDFVWNKIGFVILASVGLISSILMKFPQIFGMRTWWKVTFGSVLKRKNTVSEKDNSVSAFQSMCTSLAACIGVGNIVGVAGAISIGGPGAVFWMWIAAIIGMSTSYAENIIGVYFKRKNFNGEWSGGAMYCLRDGFATSVIMKKTGRVLAFLFSAFTVLASFGIGSIGQINKIVVNFESAFPVRSLCDIKIYDSVTLYSLTIGTVIFILVYTIISGGIKRMVTFTEKMVPFMIFFFLVGSFIVIFKNYHNIVPSFRMIFSSALNPDAGVGGILGVICSKSFAQGFKRGVFSNEAGLGSSVMVHASSDVSEPCVQGMWGIAEVFVDTVVMCSVTAMVILTSGVYTLGDATASNDGSTMVAAAFNTVFHFGNIGERFIAVSIFMFAFTSVVGWHHYGTKAWEYIFDLRYEKIYKCLHLSSIIIGSLFTSSLAWEISDTFNGLMMIPNLMGVVCFMPLIVRIHKNYVSRTQKGEKILPMTSYFQTSKKI